MPDAPPLRALLFDLGGVLLDIDAACVFTYWGQHAGVSETVLQSRFTVDAPYHAFERGEIDADAYFAHLSAQLGIELPRDVWLSGWNAMLLDARPELRTPLASLRMRVPLYLFSNTNAVHHTHWQTTCAPLLANFSRCFLSHELGQRKPDPQAFLAVADTIGLLPGEILFLDDLAENVRGAETVGFRTALVPDRSTLMQALQSLEQELVHSG